MARAIRVLWTVTPLKAPQPWRSCSRCGLSRPFRCSDKFRLNANGKRLDAWLVYKCVSCDGTWNHTVIERRAPRDIEPAMLAALQENDPTLVARFAFDVTMLRRHAHRVEEFSEVVVRKAVTGDEEAESFLLEITLATSVSAGVRLDRLLAVELGLSRSRIAAMAQSGRLTTTTALGKPVRDGTTTLIAPTKEEVEIMDCVTDDGCFRAGR